MSVNETKYRKEIQFNIQPVAELLAMPDLKIPEYQRPYKWQKTHVRQLLNDIEKHAKEGDKKYRIGTIVTHYDGAHKNIVDGQQRLTTLTLIQSCLDSSQHRTGQDKQHLTLAHEKYSSSVSQKNIRENYAYIKAFFKKSNQRDDYCDYLKRCEFVYIELDDVNEAFQFRDAPLSV